MRDSDFLDYRNKIISSMEGQCVMVQIASHCDCPSFDFPGCGRLCEQCKEFYTAQVDQMIPKDIAALDNLRIKFQVWKGLKYIAMDEQEKFCTPEQAEILRQDLFQHYREKIKRDAERKKASEAAHKRMMDIMSKP